MNLFSPSKDAIDRLYNEIAIFMVAQWMEKQGYDYEDTKGRTLEEMLEFIRCNSPPM